MKNDWWGSKLIFFKEMYAQEIEKIIINERLRSKQKINSSVVCSEHLFFGFLGESGELSSITLEESWGRTLLSFSGAGQIISRNNSRLQLKGWSLWKNAAYLETKQDFKLRINV